MIQTNTCHYVVISDLRKISPEAGEAIQAFCDYDCPVTWGDANRTMVSIAWFMNILFDAVESAGLLNGDGRHDGYQDINLALENYQDDVYIDLEN